MEGEADQQRNFLRKTGPQEALTAADLEEEAACDQEEAEVSQEDAFQKDAFQEDAFQEGAFQEVAFREDAS